MNTKKWFLASTLLIVSLAFSKAQIIPDYIVTINNDTIYGKVKLSDKRMHSIKFKPAKEHSYKTITADEIKSFTDDGWRNYESQSLDKKHKVFLRCLVKGEVSLFKVKNYFYFLRGDSLVKIEKKDTVFANVKRQDNKYLGLLKILLPECQSINNRLKPGFYGPKDFSLFVHDYNQCVTPESKSKMYFRSALQSMHIGVRASAINSALSYFLSDSKYHSTNFKSTIGAGVGVFFQVPLGKRLSVQPEIDISQKGATGEQAVRYGVTYPKLTTRSYDIKFTMVQVPIMFAYSFPTRKYDFIVSVGGVFGHAVWKKANLTENQWRQPELTEILYTQKSKLDINPGEMGYRAGFNVVIPAYKAKKISVGYYYERTLMNYYDVVDQIHTTSNVLSIGLIF